MMRLVSISTAIAMCVVTACAAADEVPLWPEGKMPNPQAVQKYKPYLVWHTPQRRTSDAILISVSGGSYKGCGIEGFEVSPIRDYFLAKGVTVVTMRYRCPRPEGLPKHLTAWQDAQRTVRMVRSEAMKRGLDPENIGFTGCSAGGHLTLMVATSSRTPSYKPIDEIDALPCHVNWAVPVYPAYGLVANADSGNIEACDDLSGQLVPEFAFDAATPPMCLVHGDADGWSPMVSVRVYHKLRTMKIPAELHVMAREPHCFMATPYCGTPAATWKDRVWEWATRMGIVSVHPDPTAKGWRPLLASVKGSIEGQADVKPGTWMSLGRGEIRAESDDALWFKGEYGNFVMDFEYSLDPAANSGVILRCPDIAKWIPNSIEVQLLDDNAEKWRNDAPYLKGAGIYGHLAPKVSNGRPAGEWNRMTIWAEGSHLKVAHNGEVSVDADLSQWKDRNTNPDGTPVPKWLTQHSLSEMAAKGRIGLQGKHGGARPRFRNLRIMPLD